LGGLGRPSLVIKGGVQIVRSQTRKSRELRRHSLKKTGQPKGQGPKGLLRELPLTSEVNRERKGNKKERISNIGNGSKCSIKEKLEGKEHGIRGSKGKVREKGSKEKSGNRGRPHGKGQRVLIVRPYAG